MIGPELLQGAEYVVVPLAAAGATYGVRKGVRWVANRAKSTPYGYIFYVGDVASLADHVAESLCQEPAAVGHLTLRRIADLPSSKVIQQTMAARKLEAAKSLAARAPHAVPLLNGQPITSGLKKDAKYGTIVFEDPGTKARILMAGKRVRSPRDGRGGTQVLVVVASPDGGHAGFLSAEPTYLERLKTQIKAKFMILVLIESVPAEKVQKANAVWAARHPEFYAPADAIVVVQQDPAETLEQVNERIAPLIAALASPSVKGGELPDIGRYVREMGSKYLAVIKLPDIRPSEDPEAVIGRDLPARGRSREFLSHLFIKQRPDNWKFSGPKDPNDESGTRQGIAVVLRNKSTSGVEMATFREAKGKIGVDVRNRTITHVWREAHSSVFLLVPPLNFDEASSSTLYSVGGARIFSVPEPTERELEAQKNAAELLKEMKDNEALKGRVSA